MLFAAELMPLFSRDARKTSLQAFSAAAAPAQALREGHNAGVGRLRRSSSVCRCFFPCSSPVRAFQFFQPFVQPPVESQRCRRVRRRRAALRPPRNMPPMLQVAYRRRTRDYCWIGAVFQRIISPASSPPPRSLLRWSSTAAGGAQLQVAQSCSPQPSSLPSGTGGTVPACIAI